MMLTTCDKIRTIGGDCLIDIPITILLIEDDSDRAFMEQLYLDYSKLMYAVAMSRLGNPLDAEDAVHEAILRLIDKILTCPPILVPVSELVEI